jgi:hypothetical protein
MWARDRIGKEIKGENTAVGAIQTWSDGSKEGKAKKGNE